MSSRNRLSYPGALGLVAGVVVLILAGHASRLIAAAAKVDKRPFTASFRPADCTFQSMGSANPYFILDPGHELHLVGEEDKEEVDLVITVLGDTQDITIPGLGTVRTRVVEEREKADGELKEVSRNFFAICEETSDVFYFGEDVDIYEAGVIVEHHGAWRAGTNGAMPGLIMPGSFLLGSRYFQEVAPGVALDRGENTGMDQLVTVPAGSFPGSITILETSALERNAKGTKIYAPGVGLIVDGTVRLVDWTPAH